MHYDVGSGLTKRRLSRLLLLVVGLVLLSVAGYFVFSTWQQNDRPAQVSEKSQPKAAVKSEQLTTRILFVGDIFWGRAVQTRAEQSSQSYEYLTSGLRMAERTRYNAWIGNFECPITDDDVSYQQQVDSLLFNCRPEYLPNLAKWFTAASLANNHTMNRGGQSGLVESRQHMEDAGIQHFGNYDMSKLEDICEVITVPATTSAKRSVSLPLALCGYMQVVNVPPTDAQLAVMEQYAKVMPVIAMPHMGVEYRNTAEAEKVSAYRRMIDHGADAVIGAHPHVIQNSEVYKGKLIAYSLGNFLFDQQSLGLETSLGLGVSIKLTIADDEAVQTYEKIAPKCEQYRDDCLTELTTALPERPPIEAAYDFVCFDQSRAVDNVPTRCSDELAEQAERTATTGQLTNLQHTW